MLPPSSLLLTAALCLSTGHGDAATAAPPTGFNSWPGRRVSQHHPSLIFPLRGNRNLAVSPASGDVARKKHTVDYPGSPAISRNKLQQQQQPLRLLAADMGLFLPHDARFKQHEAQVARNKVDLFRRLSAVAAAARNSNSAAASEIRRQSVSHQTQRSPAHRKIETQIVHGADLAALAKRLLLKAGGFYKRQGHNALLGTSSKGDGGFGSSRRLEASEAGRLSKVSSGVAHSRVEEFLANGDTGSGSSGLMPPPPPPRPPSPPARWTDSKVTTLSTRTAQTERRDEAEGSSSGDGMENARLDTAAERAIETTALGSQPRLVDGGRHDSRPFEAPGQGAASRDGAARSWREFVARADGGEGEQGEEVSGGGILTLPVRMRDLRSDECRAVPFRQRVWVSGCEPVFVDNAFCLGHCGSFHVPRAGGQTPLAGACACVPAGQLTRAVPLRCGHNLTSRTVNLVRACACTA